MRNEALQAYFAQKDLSKELAQKQQDLEKELAQKDFEKELAQKQKDLEKQLVQKDLENMRKELPQAKGPSDSAWGL